MKLISHVVTPNRLFLAWQAPDERGDRYRYAVGEITRAGVFAKLRYFDEDEFQAFNNSRSRKQVEALGFGGYPGFAPSKREHAQGVLGALMRRVPTQTRADFSSYRQQFRLSEDLKLSDFDLLGLTEAKLPSDGFSVVDPFDESAQHDMQREIMFEVAGYRHRSPENRLHVAVGDLLSLHPEPSNPYDSRAVAFHRGDKHVGYVNRLQAPAFLRWLERAEISAVIDRLNGSLDRPRAFAFVTVKPTQKAFAA